MTDTARLPQRAARRRGEILDAARRLFAAHGVAATTTNRIAAEAGVSPGNLYYWFPSKTELIRALFADWSERMSLPDALSDGDAESLRMLWHRVTEQRQPDPEYAFFLRELLPLLHADPILATSYRDAYAGRRNALIALAGRLVEGGLLRAPEPPTTIGDLVGLLWLASETAHPFSEAVGDDLVDARRYGRAVLQSFLTPAGRRVVDLPQREEARP